MGDSAAPAAATLVLPIFPLPEVTLFPHTFLPLHIFEARYRAMVADALARDRRLAVARLEPGYESTYDGRPPVRAVAGAGEIVNWERQPAVACSTRSSVLARCSTACSARTNRPR